MYVYGAYVCLREGTANKHTDTRRSNLTDLVSQKENATSNMPVTNTYGTHTLELKILPVNVKGS